MKRRFTKLPIASIAVVIGSLLVGLSMSPAGAQSQLTNGQVTVRSDGAVYLIANNQRRWVATVQITDEELNAYPEAEPIYAGLVPFGSASAGTASTGTTASKTGTTASKTGSTGTTIASKTGSTATKVASKTGSSSSSSSTEEDDVEPGQVVINPTSGADKKNPNDPTLAAAPSTADPTGRTEPTSSTSCPDSHKVKGGFDKKYYDVDRPQYLDAEVEACFRTGKDARDAGYTEAKKQATTSSSSTSR
jgi:hypothetical protein